MRKLLWATFLVWTSSAAAQDLEVNRRIPNEYETVGGLGLGLGNNAVAGQSGISAVRVNPALLATEKNYSVAAGYNWPTEGRDFFQAGILDSKSSKVAAGFSYTGFMDDYRSDEADENEKPLEQDSPLKRRAVVGIAQTMGLLTAGIGGQYAEGEVYDVEKGYRARKGTAINIGVLGLLTPSIRFGASVENLANRKIEAFSPRTIRAGVSYLSGGGDVILNFDLRQRERVAGLEKDKLLPPTSGALVPGSAELQAEQQERARLEDEDRRYQAPERMAFTSISARVYDMLRILGSYGKTISGPERQAIAGGIAIVSGNFSLSYSAARPYMSEPESQQAVNASFVLNM